MRNSNILMAVMAMCSKPLFSISVLIVLLFNSQFANAIGVGGASADSFIGERLVGTIPVFNVRNPDQLQLNILSSTFTESGGPTLSAVLDRSNGQLAIRIESDLPVNEPYVSFTMEVIDQADAINKEFILLLNLAPKGAQLSAQSTPYAAPAPQAVALAEKQVASGSLMGPYEWAEAGNIPQRFGAVIDGQSLWRVARRINEAMGVSVNQMMLALYQQNKDAFLTNSVDSLQAGSYLTIPSYEQTARVSDSEAKNQLQRLSEGLTSTSAVNETSNQASTSSQDSAVSDVIVGAENISADKEVSELNSPTAEPVESEGLELGNQGSEPIADAESFRLSGLDAQEDGAGTTPLGSRDEKSQEIISSLAATVGNLTQELIQKDKKIEFLEGKIAALEELVGVDANAQARLALSNNDAVATSPELTSEIAEPDQDETSAWSWMWLLLPLLLILGLLFRTRIGVLAQDLNLFGGKAKVDFGRVKQEDAPVIVPPVAATQRSEAPVADEYPVFSASPELTANELDLEHSEIDLNQPPDEETVLELEDPSILEFNESNMDFDQRFERLLDEQDYDFALELLNFARHNEIEEDRYHCERLRLLQAMNDEDAFYNYYYDIESSISSFDLAIQNRISQLVVDLAQSKAQ